MNPKFPLMDQYADEGLLRRVEDETGKLVLYNYTDQCVYNRKWNRITQSARGTVYNLINGHIVARAFDKFFNFEELSKSKQRNLLKQKKFEVYDKADGSLGIVYTWLNQWRVNTRGSFSSDQAVKASEMLKQYRTEDMYSEYTYLVEIIYPDNKIIMDYGDTEQLVLLAMINKLTGEELPYELVQSHGDHIGMPVIPRRVFNSIEELIEAQQALPKDQEGFVVKFENGERVKFKSPAYMEIARAMAHMTPIHFWKKMKDGKIPEDFIAGFPEELRTDVDEIVGKLESNFNTLKETIAEEFSRLHHDFDFFYDQDGKMTPECKQRLCKYLGQNLKDYEHPNGIFCLIHQNYDKLNDYVKKNIRPNRNEL